MIPENMDAHKGMMSTGNICFLCYLNLLENCWNKINNVVYGLNIYREVKYMKTIAQRQKGEMEVHC